MGNTEAAHHAAVELVAWVSQVVALLPEDSVVWDPTLVRGMGYYTSSIVEISHPELGGSLGGGGRYDGMIGRFLGKNVPAMGLSLGFERLLDVVPLAPLTHPNRVALVMEGEGSGAAAMVLKMHLVGSGHTVRVVAGSRNMRAVYDRLVADGFSKVAEVHGSAGDVHRVEDLIWRELG
jgi:histidyl-tRNA synthetase